MAVYKRDIVDINLETGNIHRSFLKHSIGYKDQKADHFGIRTYRDGVPVDLTGVSVQGIFLPPQGDPIAITSGNIVDGNVAEVVLPQACYNYDGQFTLSIKLVDPTNAVTGTMRIVDGMVDNTHASGTVAPTAAVPTYQEILATYEAMLAATTAATTAATNVGSIVAAAYSTSATYAVGDYCTKDGNLYRCTTAITTAESWTAAHWTQTKMGPDVSDLKSAMSVVDFNSKSFSVPINTAHSSDDDKVSTYIKTGEKYYVKVSCNANFYSFQIYAFYADGTKAAVKSDVINDIPYELTATKDIIAVSVYKAAVSTRGYDATLLVERAIPTVFDVDTLKDKTRIFSYSEFSVDANKAHSSEYNRLPVNIKTDEVFFFNLKASKTLESVSLNAVNADGTTTSVGTGLTSNRVYQFTASKNIVYLGIYIPSQSTAYTARPVVEIHEDTIIRLPVYEKTINEYGSFSKTFTSDGTAHSSTKDKVIVNISTGETFKAGLYSSISSRYSCQIRAFYADNTDETLASEVPFNNFKEFTASKEIIAIGAYIGAVSSAYTATLTVQNSNKGFENAILENGHPFASCAKNDLGYASKLTTFASLFNGESTDIDSFLFFTDPHIFGKPYSEQGMEKAIGSIEYAFNNSPTSFVLCGGDWLESDDTQAEACYKLGRIDGIMNRLFPDAYYPLLGNHDNNYQGVNGQGTANAGALAQNVMVNLWYRKYGKMYYDFKTASTRYYAFDSGTDWVQTMNDYRWGQVDWFANKLLTNDDSHSVIAIHIYTIQTKAQYQSDAEVQPLADNLTKIAQAYNARQSITLNGQTYNFASSTGKVAYLICGHSHYDMETTWNDIPIIVTTNANYKPSFDLCYADYDTGKLNMVRFGTGDNRQVTIIV